MYYRNVFNVGPAEMIVVALVLLMAVGPEQLPGVIRRVGRGASQIRSMTEGLRSDFMAGMEEIERATDAESWAKGSGPGGSEKPHSARQSRASDDDVITDDIVTDLTPEPNDSDTPEVDAESDELEQLDEPVTEDDAEVSEDDLSADLVDSNGSSASSDTKAEDTEPEKTESESTESDNTELDSLDSAGDSKELT